MRTIPLAIAIGLSFGKCSDRDSATTCDRDPPLTYYSWGRGFLDKHCTGCHSSLVNDAQRNEAPKGVNFDTYEGVLPWVAQIESRAIYLDPDPMPPGGGPTAEELQLLQEWLDCQVEGDAQEYFNGGGAQ